MNKILPIAIITIVIIGFAAMFIFSQSNSVQAPTTSPVADSQDSADDSSQMMEKEQSQSDGEAMASSGKYIDYSTQSYEDAEDKARVIFFHAQWCPTCQAADTDIRNNLDEIPDDVVILRADYDTEAQLKQRYGITYQHTFVQVDSEGNEVAKWNGGGLDQVVTKIN